MQREERSERSQRRVLDGALHLFSHRGYRATTVRDIADEAKVSTGNVYHHFPDKESIFRTLLDEFSAITETKRCRRSSRACAPAFRRSPRCC